MGVYDPKKQKFWNGPTIVGTIVLIIGGYLGSFYLPHWFNVWRMTGAMRGIGNDAYHTLDNEKLYPKLLDAANRIGLRGVEKEDFKIERIPYPEGALADKDDYAKNIMTLRGKAIRISLDYYIDAQWPLQEKITELHFQRTIETDLTIISW